MLSFILSSGGELSWHVGEKNRLSHEEVSEVTEVQADCDELEYILDNYCNLPYFKGRRVQRWFGDHAKFIAGTLR